MKKSHQTGITAIRTIPVLSISPFSEDHLRLKEVLGGSDLVCVLERSDTLRAAAAVLRRQQFAVVICEYDLLPGSWQDVLAMISELPFPSSLIVTSRLADERKWAESLNLGAYDLLAKPFDKDEVYRAVSAAWRHWQHQHEDRTEAPESYLTARS